jgi:hypothetical protein
MLRYPASRQALDSGFRRNDGLKKKRKYLVAVLTRAAGDIK